MTDLLWRGILIGIGATIIMDIWAYAVSFLPGQSRPDWTLVGRWFWYLRRGQIFHDDINTMPPYRHELALGWIGHGTVGILYGVIFAFYGGKDWFAHPVFLPAWIFGILTVGAGWFLLQPGLGIGWAASRLPNATNVRIMNLLSHTFFALGLYWTAWLLQNFP